MKSFSREQQTLSICRVLFFLFLFFHHGSYQFELLGHFPASLWMPVDIIKWLPWQPPSFFTLTWIGLIWKISLIFAAFGLFARFAVWLSCALGFYLFAVSVSFVSYSHLDQPIALALVVVALSPCTNAYTLDNWLSQKEPKDDPVNSAFAIWVIWLLWACVFGAAGFAKLKASGLTWISSDSLVRFIIRNQYMFYDPNRSDWSLAAVTLFNEHPSLAKGAAASVIGLELIAPLVLFSKLARRILIPCLLGMHIVIRQVLVVSFTGYLAIYLFFVDWAYYLNLTKQLYYYFRTWLKRRLF